MEIGIGGSKWFYLKLLSVSYLISLTDLLTVHVSHLDLTPSRVPPLKLVPLLKDSHHRAIWPQALAVYTPGNCAA